MKVMSNKQRLVAAIMATVLLITVFSGCSRGGDSNGASEWENPLVAPDKFGPTIDPEMQLQSKIQGLKAQNSDTVGWLKIPNTEVDAGVVQTTNNNFYMRRNELKQSQFTGCYFADFENNLKSRDTLSRNTVVYGHNIEYTDNPNGQKFSQLFKFADETFAKENPYIYFSIDGEDLVWEIYSVMYTDTKFKYVYIKDMTDAGYTDLIKETKLRSQYVYNDVNVTDKDKILILSTCSYKYGIRSDVRFLVVAKLLPADATLKEAADITINPNPKGF